MRLRRARTPSNAAPVEPRERSVTGAMNLPDLLPSTFRLAEQSSLFSKFNDEDAVTRRANENYQNSKSYAPQVSQITLEKVQYFEPEHAETVNIVDLSEDNTSDTSEGCSTPKRSRDNLQFIPLKKNEPPRVEVKTGSRQTERINSFYESDKEGHEEPLVFSEDEDTEIEASLVHYIELIIRILRMNLLNPFTFLPGENQESGEEHSKPV